VTEDFLFFTHFGRRSWACPLNPCYLLSCFVRSARCDNEHISGLYSKGISGWTPRIIRVYVFLLSHSEKTRECFMELGYDRFLPCPVSIISYLPVAAYHCVCCSLNYKFEILTVMFKIHIFWGVMSCRRVKSPTLRKIVASSYDEHAPSYDDHEVHED
jgi:hypothetical protein